MARDRELMRSHVEALFVHDADGRLVRVNEPDGATAPRFFLGVTRDGIVRRFRHDAAPVPRRELVAESDWHALRASAETPMDPAPYAAILARSAPVVRAWAGPAFAFPPALPESPDTTLVTAASAEVLTALLRDWMPDVERCQPVVALIVDGHAAAVCASVRRTTVAHEAGVETAAAFRGRGYAARVVSAWAHAVRRSGRVPLYSTSWANEPSLALARKLGLIAFGSDVHVS